jgi:sugar phosphate isomerase/epimerase
MIYVSTTYYGSKRSDLKIVLDQLKDLDIDGIEVGSTHSYKKKKDFVKLLNNLPKKKILFNNYFPPNNDKNFVINIASGEKKIRKNSINFVMESINFSKKVGAELYTFHPGFLSDAQPAINNKEKNYDFNFDKRVSKKIEAKKFLIQSLKEIISYSVSKKLKIAIETEGSSLKHNFLMMQSPKEFDELFKIFPKNLYLNFNISHSYFASTIYNFSLVRFINKIKEKIAAVELSCNDGFYDQHLPIKLSSNNLQYIKYFENVPIILEYRNTSYQDLNKSIIVLKRFLKK